MTEIFTITNYQYYSFSSRESGSKAVAVCTGDAGKVLYVHFRGGTEDLPSARKIDDNRYIVYYRHSDMPNIVDMLRNEKPLYLMYLEESPNNTRISTGSEPVGEGEEH